MLFRQILIGSTALGLLLAPTFAPTPAWSQGAPADASGGVLAQASPARPADGTPGNPPGTAAGRALDRTLGTNTTGINPAAAPSSPSLTPAPAGLAVEQEGLRNSHRMSKLIGAALYNEADERVGEVEDVLLPVGSGQTIAIISVGGFLGIGAKLVAVPFSRLRSPAAQDGHWMLAGATKDSLGSLPTFAYGTQASRS